MCEIMRDMHGMESDLKGVNRKALVQRAILASVATVGLLAMVAVAPAAFQILKIIDPKRTRKRDLFRNSTYRARDALFDKGYVEFVQTPSGKKFRLTLEGENYLRRLEGKEYEVAKPKKWDGHFRIVTFDIKEPRKGTRERLRRALRQIGFYQLQKSVWVYPYDCEELITMLKADFKIGKEILYIIASRIEFDKPLREYFGLPFAK